MRDDRAQGLLNYGLDWGALFSWTLIIAGFSAVSLASVVLLP
jgi:hypothetical protein